MIKILVADDHPIVRKGIIQILNGISKKFLIDETDNAQDTIHKAVNNDYEIILLDISMPKGGGLDALKQIIKNKPYSKILMLSVHDDRQYILRSIKMGACGYLTKTSAPEELENAIKKVRSGGKYLSSSVAVKIAFIFDDDLEKLKHENLTNREFQVFSLYVKGKTTSDIAQELSISAKTVSTYRTRIMKKMNLKSIYEVIKYALEHKKENGEYDFEALNAIDLDLLNADLQAVLNGKEVQLPKFNFITGKSEKSHKRIILDKNEILIFEGIHGLNDNLTFSVPFNQKVKIYVSALNNLNIDAHNRIPTTDSRKFRRIIRDYNFRGYSAEQTLERWDSIREGEDENIFPFQENADMMFNSTLTYELGVLKKYVVPLLQNISKYSPVYLEAKRLLKMLAHFSNIPDELVPSNSILREFIGGSIFKY